MTSEMSLAVYIHIPYCLQRCRYCDFTTFEADQIMPPQEYVALLKAEIDQRAILAGPQRLRSVFFGGGTPSLIPAEMIVSLLQALANTGFTFDAATEVTIEINPATVDPKKLEVYLAGGVNRFSVGAQTFDDGLLALCGRRHSAADTRATLRLLESFDLNYSFDLLFALPGQKIAGLKSDLDEVGRFKPSHLSAYCLTVPEGHPMDRGRPPEEHQIEMFDLIEERLAQQGIERYEISNFARPGKESVHNMTYWSDLPYWGIGLSSHSYFLKSTWGTRFWNPKSFEEYAKQVQLKSNTGLILPDSVLPNSQFEKLTFHESLSDFCHMFLRTKNGLSLMALRKKYGNAAFELAQFRAQKAVERDLLALSGDNLSLTRKGLVLSNQVFADLHFEAKDCPLPDAINLA